MSVAALSLEVRKLCKSFAGRRVLHDLDFEMRAGEIHALIGENGSGKSTFIRCLSGYYAPDEGAEIIVRGQPMRLPFTPEEALSAGFSFIHQNLGLAADLTVLENLALSRGFAAGRAWNIHWSSERKRSLRALQAVGANINPNTEVRDLPVAERTLVAIARGLQASEDHNGSILVLDEPTAALPPHDVERLFSALRGVARKGVSILYVSHRLNEILELADRVTALRNGRIVKTAPIAGMSERDLVQLIVGRELETHRVSPSRRSGEGVVVLETQNLAGAHVRDVNLSVRAGELVGIAGLLGSGRSELGRLVFGAQRRTSGVIKLNGQEVDLTGPAAALANGVGYVSQDRLRQGGFGQLSVVENMTMPDLSMFWRGGRLRHGEERRAAARLITSFNIRPNDPSAAFDSLSGGNQQKVILARMLRLPLKLLILDEPVQGVDIGAKNEIHHLIRQAASEGLGVILIDSDFEDLCRLCDRILVINHGRVTTELGGPGLTADRVSEMAYLSAEAV
jgi:ribose transport system ATP-binding protein